MQLKSEAEALARVCDLVDEARWRYDLKRVSFLESIFTSPVYGSFLLDLWVMGEDYDGWWIITATRDQRVNGLLLEARIDAGNNLLEARNLGELFMAARERKWMGESVYERAITLAQQESLRKGTI